MYRGERMESSYLTGIAALDAQHEEIDEAIDGLLKVLDRGEDWETMHYLLIRIQDLLRFHISLEETIMDVFEYPKADQHREVHQGILDTVRRLVVATLQGGEGGLRELGAQRLFLSHVHDHDFPMAEYVRGCAAQNPTSLRRI